MTSALPNLDDVTKIAVDTETSGLDMFEDYIVGFVLTWSPAPEDSIYLPIRHKSGGNLPDTQAVIAYMKRLLARTDLHTIYHNAAFDIWMLRKEGIVVNGWTEDTEINMALIDENVKSFSLDASCRYFGVQEKKGDALYAHIMAVTGITYTKPHESMAHYWELPGDDPIAVDYAVGDGTSTFCLQIAQQKHLDDQNLRETWRVECRLINTLHRCQFRGVHVDVNRLDQVQEQIENELVLSGEDVDGINVGSPKQVETWLEGRKKQGDHVPAYKYTDKGNISFPSKWLERFPAGKMIVKTRKLIKLSTAFITPLRDKHLRGTKIYPSFSQMVGDEFGTRTGRLSSYKPNMQQVNKRDKELGWLFRQVFVPPEGMWWWEADYSQCEYRLFAHFANSQALIDAYNNPNEIMDMHQIVADMVGLERDPAKTINFAILYGRGKKALAEDLGISLAEAKAVLDRYFENIPEAKALMERASKMCRHNGYMKTILGRRRHFDDPWNQGYMALNAACQGSNADIMKIKMVETEDFLMSEGLGEYGFSVHDANNFWAPAGDTRIADEVIRIGEDFSHVPFIKSLRVGMRLETKGGGRNWAEASYGRQEEAMAA